MAACLTAVAANFADETLHYKVMFKWGLINKQAGTVAINLTNTPDQYVGRLTAKSASWADKFYRVRDTLNCRINKEGFESVFYEKISHEGNEDKQRRSALSPPRCHRVRRLLAPCQERR